jgi:hypothetical protein
MEPAERLYETLLQAGLLNDLRRWNARDGQQVDSRGSVWKTHSPGLKDIEKEKWRRAAQQLGLK